MSDFNKKRYAPNGKQNKISLDIRHGIRKGIYPIDSKLPPRVEFEKRYDSSPVTIQKAFDKLQKEGFVRSEGQRGTFVSATAPCFKNYAIILSFDIEECRQEVSFYHILVDIVNKRRNKKRKFILYEGLNGHVDEPDYIRLLNDVKQECLAGIIFASSPYLIYKTELFRELKSRKHLPKVAFMTSDQFHCVQGIRSLCSTKDIVEKIFDSFEKRNIKRVSVVTTLAEHHSEKKANTEEIVFQEAKNRGMDMPIYNYQVVHHEISFKVRELVHLLLKDEKGKRPDALLIMNDALVEPATKAVKEMGLKVPDDLVVVSYCNFPDKPKAWVDSFWYGINVNTFIDSAVAIVDKMSKGKPIDGLNLIPLEFYLD